MGFSKDKINQIYSDMVATKNWEYVMTKYDMCATSIRAVLKSRGIQPPPMKKRQGIMDDGENRGISMKREESLHASTWNWLLSNNWTGGKTR